MPDIIQTLLTRRGIIEPSAIEAFLNPDYELHTHSPQLLPGMDRALARLFLALERSERIAIYADFDCDGIPGAAVLSDFLTKIGYSNLEVYLPHRDREGYGLHTEAIAALARRGVSLIITVDVGTTAQSAVAFAKEKGVDVIVTDHHEIVGPLPDAIAVLNPKLQPAPGGVEGYPFPHLCGAAVAFKLAQGALHEGKRRGLERFQSIPDGWEKWLLDLVAIATIADMVPLVDENRVLAHFGLRVLRRSPRPGIRALCARMRVREAQLTEDDVGFSIAPRLNAASRMDEPDCALRLLITNDANEAERLAEHLEKLNGRRKGMVASMVRQAQQRAAQRFGKDDPVVVLGDPHWKPALLGLAANSILGTRRLPDGTRGVVCLWGRDAVGRIRGSCRSDGAVSVVGLFENAGELLEEYGGHSASGGFTVSHERVHQLPEALCAAAKGLAREAREMPSHEYALTLSEISAPLFAEVSKLAPFGAGNPKPVFLFSGALVTDVRRFGREGSHVEVMLECRRTGASARAFQFFRSPEQFSLMPAPGAAAAVFATLERDSFRGGFALRIVDIAAAA